MSEQRELRCSPADAIGPLWRDLGVHVVFFSVAQSDEVLVRVLLESYEEIGVARAHDPHFAPGRTLLSLLVVPDGAAHARRALEALQQEVAVQFHSYRPAWMDALRRELDITQ